MFFFFFFQAEDGIRDIGVTGVQTCALPDLPRLKSKGWIQKNDPHGAYYNRKSNCTLKKIVTKTTKLP